LIHRSSIVFLVLLGLTAVAAPPAVAVVFGPDMPGWAPSQSPAPAPAVDENQSDRDPLNPIREKLSRAEDLARSGKASDAAALSEDALKQLGDLPPSRPGVSSLRERLEDVRDRAARSGDDQADVADGAPDRPKSLKPVEPERNERVDVWMAYYTGRGRERFQLGSPGPRRTWIS